MRDDDRRNGFEAAQTRGEGRFPQIYPGSPASYLTFQDLPVGSSPPPTLRRFAPLRLFQSRPPDKPKVRALPGVSSTLFTASADSSELITSLTILRASTSQSIGELVTYLSPVSARFWP